jgi:hypothetical protein
MERAREGNAKNKQNKERDFTLREALHLGIHGELVHRVRALLDVLI